MNCRERQHDIILFLYDELPASLQGELRAHIDDCPACREFYETEQSIHFQLSEDFSEWEVPADLLMESRKSLSEELDRLDQRAWWLRFPATPHLRMRLLESAALVSIGLAVGVYVMNERELAPQTAPGPSLLTDTSVSIPDPAAVSNLRITSADPATGRVELTGEVVRPVELQGNLEDPNVRDLLFGALRSTSNAGVRLRAVELLAKDPRDARVKQALIGALLSDGNIGVRLQALDGLQSFSGEDDVRQALIYALENDANPGVRVKAIEALTPLTADEAMDGIVTEAVREDPNAYITMRALQFVGTGN
jgi:hypothetical protein